ncbi:MAG TPA: hypothetical protein VGK78_13005, partial [Nocardioides sp.]
TPRWPGTVGIGVGVSGVSGDGTELSGSTIRRLACDAEIIPAVLGSRGEPLDVGRARRLVTVAIWAALVFPTGTVRSPAVTGRR